MPFGERLREARLKKQITLKDVEASTRIRVKYLEALETENMHLLPGKAYAIGFLKTYAKFLNIEDSELLLELKMHYQIPDVQERDHNYITPANSNNTLKYFTMVAFGILFIAIIVLTLYYKPIGSEQGVTGANKIDKPASAPIQPKSTEDNQPEQNTPIQDKTKLPSKTDPANSSVQQGQQVILHAKGRVWISVSTDGKNTFEGIIYKGQEKQFTGKTIKVKLGNAQLVNVIHNGTDLGILSNSRKVITKDFIQ